MKDTTVTVAMDVGDLERTLEARHDIFPTPVGAIVPLENHASYVLAHEGCIGFDDRIFMTLDIHLQKIDIVDLLSTTEG